LATNQIAQTGLSSLPPVIYYSEQLFSEAPVLPAAGLREYWKKLDRLSGSDDTGAYLISPSGKSEWIPVAIWNERHVEAMPGATLFVGFAPSVLPEQYKDLNTRMLTLLANRMPK
ncbi:capsule biosynthesis GfcC family protein, partial [Aeromonas caviae]